ncbi:hypothetical protein Mapa_002349 [Marchantia paleacea]|nr:hypothetical protein Mapa_002349 [Marchantia paleacea]
MSSYNRCNRAISEINIELSLLNLSLSSATDRTVAWLATARGEERGDESGDHACSSAEFDDGERDLAACSELP